MILLILALIDTMLSHIIMASPPGSNSAADNKAPMKSGLCEKNQPVETVTQVIAGNSIQVTLKGSAPHGGGGCFFSLSYDNGKTFQIIYKTDAQCPIKTDYSITIPKDIPSGPALFVWSWVPVHSGQKEYYMTCSKISVSGGTASKMRGISMPIYNLPGYPEFYQNGPQKSRTKNWVDSVKFDNRNPTASSVSSGSGVSYVPTVNQVRQPRNPTVSSGSTYGTGMSYVPDVNQVNGYPEFLQNGLPKHTTKNWIDSVRDAVEGSVKFDIRNPTVNSVSPGSGTGIGVSHMPAVNQVKQPRNPTGASGSAYGTGMAYVPDVNQVNGYPDFFQNDPQKSRTKNRVDSVKFEDRNQRANSVSSGSGTGMAYVTDVNQVKQPPYIIYNYSTNQR
jgi:hypothetical protein